MSSTLTSNQQLALWANQVTRECLLQAGDDVDSALAAAELIVSTHTPDSFALATSTPIRDKQTAARRSRDRSDRYKYKNLGGDSNVKSYRLIYQDDPGIIVNFKDGQSYKYTESSIGERNLYRMLVLAGSGQGLNSFINRELYYDYTDKGGSDTALSISSEEDYPRDSSNRFLDKYRIAEAARDGTKLEELRSSLPDSEQPKLDHAIYCLHNEGIIHHPSENPGLGINLDGVIANSEWASYDISFKEWQERDSLRTSKLEEIQNFRNQIRNISSITKIDEELVEAGPKRALTRIKSAFKSHSDRWDELEKELSRVTTSNSDIHRVQRIRHKGTVVVNREISAYKRFSNEESEEASTNLTTQFQEVVDEIDNLRDQLDDAFEDAAEHAYETLERECLLDCQPQEPLASSVSLAFDESKIKRDASGKFATKSGSKTSKTTKPIETGKDDGDSSKRGGQGADASSPDSTSESVESKTARPSSEKVSKDREGTDQPSSTETNRDAESNKPNRESREKLSKINKEMSRYASSFRKAGQKDVADWFKMLKSHINEAGTENALNSLSTIDTSNAVAPIPSSEKVQYKGTGYFDESDNSVQFLKNYLDNVGIVLQTGATRNPDLKVISSAPIPSTIASAKEGDVIAKATNVTDKLEESKSLPGLESSEDIHKIVGEQVTQFTPEVLSKLDETYGKGKWIVKSYGDEAYAGFGVFFPQRIASIQQSSKQTLWDTNKKLKKLGYTLRRSDSGEVSGIADINTNQTYNFDSSELNTIKDIKVKKLASIAAASAPQENGTILPVTPEQSLRQDYGVLLRKGEDGKVIGITDEDGAEVDINTPEWNKLIVESKGELPQTIGRAVAAADSSQGSDSRFMVQPAFEAVGVSEADRARGLTFETSTEGRVHVTTNNGKASVIPYATLAGRKDAFPVVFKNDDIIAMEQAVQEAVDSLPEAERSGQTYAPDVMKTKDGWRVVELNASVEGGQSLWLEENPFVIDAYVSHITGREPSHAQFIRQLLTDKSSSKTPGQIGT